MFEKWMKGRRDKNVAQLCETSCGPCYRKLINMLVSKFLRMLKELVQMAPHLLSLDLVVLTISMYQLLNAVENLPNQKQFS